MGSDRIRILVAKLGLDGHDRGAKVVARVLRDQGFEVVYSGLHQTATKIAVIAMQEDVDVIGLSVLSGAHIPHTRDLRDELKRLDMNDVRIVVGGVIPEADHEALRNAGADELFPAGTNVLEIGKRIRALLGVDTVKEAT